jgi:hypothetical protein
VSGERQAGEERGGDHEGRLRAHQHLALIETVRDSTAEETEEAVGAELTHGEDADGER